MEWVWSLIGCMQALLLRPGSSLGLATLFWGHMAALDPGARLGPAWACVDLYSVRRDIASEFGALHWNSPTSPTWRVATGPEPPRNTHPKWGFMTSVGHTPVVFEAMLAPRMLAPDCNILNAFPISLCLHMQTTSMICHMTAGTCPMLDGL